MPKTAKTFYVTTVDSGLFRADHNDERSDDQQRDPLVLAEPIIRIKEAAHGVLRSRAGTRLSAGRRFGGTFRAIPTTIFSTSSWLGKSIALKAISRRHSAGVSLGASTMATAGAAKTSVRLAMIALLPDASSGAALVVGGQCVGDGELDFRDGLKVNGQVLDQFADSSEVPGFDIVILAERRH